MFIVYLLVSYNSLSSSVFFSELLLPDKHFLSQIILEHTTADAALKPRNMISHLLNYNTKTAA